jgi:predicted ribosomally synthesized peptide with SipW-like signal peptide
MGLEPLNGKTGEWVRLLIAMAVAGTVAYFTAQTEIERRMTQTDGQVAAVKALEQAHFEEVQRSLIRIERAVERIEGNGVDRRTGEPFSLQRQFDK